MFDLFIKFAGYMFIIYITLFIYNGVVFILDEFALTKKEHRNAIFSGRTLIVLIHIKAFIILSYDRETISFNNETLLIGVLGLAFIMVANFLANKFYRNSCPLIWNCVFFLLDLGLIMLQRLDSMLAFKQLVWIVLGFFIAMWIPTIISIIPRFEMFEKVYIVLG